MIQEITLDMREMQLLWKKTNGVGASKLLTHRQIQGSSQPSANKQSSPLVDPSC